MNVNIILLREVTYFKTALEPLAEMIYSAPQSCTKARKSKRQWSHSRLQNETKTKQRESLQLEMRRTRPAVGPHCCFSDTRQSHKCNLRQDQDDACQAWRLRRAGTSHPRHSTERTLQVSRVELFWQITSTTRKEGRHCRCRDSKQHLALTPQLVCRRARAEICRRAFEHVWAAGLLWREVLVSDRWMTASDLCHIRAATTLTGSRSLTGLSEERQERKSVLHF